MDLAVRGRKASILEETQRVADNVVAPLAERTDKELRWPAEAFEALQAAGLLGLVVPHDAGGHGQGLMALARTSEILGRACTSTGISVGMHHVATAVIAANATRDHHNRYLRPIARGEHITSLALSEPGTGSHFWLPETSLEDRGNHFVVEGEKAFCTNGSHADSYVVSVESTGPNARIGTFSCIMVPNETPGLQWGRPWRGLGMRGNSSRTMHLNGVRVPKRDLLGQPGDQTWYVFHVVTPYFLMAMAGTYMGAAQHALDIAAEHLKEREHSHSRSRLAHLDHVQHEIGRLWTDLEATRSLVYRAAEAADRDDVQAMPLLSAAKARVAEVAVHVVNECMTLTGGRYYRDGSPLDRLLRDVRAAHVMSPTTDLLYTWVGRGLLDQPLLGD